MRPSKTENLSESRVATLCTVPFGGLDQWVVGVGHEDGCIVCVGGCACADPTSEAGLVRVREGARGRRGLEQGGVAAVSVCVCVCVCVCVWSWVCGFPFFTTSLLLGVIGDKGQVPSKTGPKEIGSVSEVEIRSPKGRCTSVSFPMVHAYNSVPPWYGLQGMGQAEVWLRKEKGDRDSASYVHVVYWVAPCRFKMLTV